MATTKIRLPVSAGRYNFLEKVGKGATGTVYRAKDRYSGEVVAIKVLNEKFSTNVKVHSRFAQEFEAATKLEHPNIVRALDFGIDGSTYYLVTEFVEGTSLGDMVESRKRLPEEEAVRIITQVAQALSYAHKRRIIHRDVKPDNILVRADGLAKLADFGLAKDFENDRDLTRTSSALGTPHFMAPELYRDAKTAGPRCDIYSLGATLYNLVTGQVPFEGCGSIIALSKKVKGDMAAASSLAPGVSERVDEVIRRAMSPDPNARPASCLEFFKIMTGGPAGWNTLSRTSLLRTFRAPRPPRDRRNSGRQAWVLGTSGSIDTGIVDGAEDATESWPVIVKDVSTGGVGLLLARRFERGTVFAVELGVGNSVRNVRVRVCRVGAEAMGHWFHGCSFVDPLSEDELAALLAAPPSGG